MKNFRFFLIIITFLISIPPLLNKNLKNCNGSNCNPIHIIPLHNAAKERSYTTAKALDEINETLTYSATKKNLLDQVKYIPNSEVDLKKVMNPHFVKSGGLTNVANSATKLITPLIAGPKTEVVTVETVKEVVSGPVAVGGFVGRVVDKKVYNSDKGRIEDGKKIQVGPEFVSTNKVISGIKVERKLYDDNNNGELIQSNEELKTFGTEK